MDDAARLRASRRKLNVAFGAMFGVVALCFVAYDVERNLAMSARLAPACETLHRELPGRMPPELMRALFEDDAPFMRRVLVDSYDHRCRMTQEQLAWWRWNLGVKVDFAPPRADRERAAAILDRTAARCPEMMRDMVRQFVGPGRDAQIARDVTRACAPISDASREMRADQLPMSAWDEAAVLAGIADALEIQAAHGRDGAVFSPVPSGVGPSPVPSGAAHP